MKNRRLKQRYGARYRGHVRFEGKSFEIETNNISISGARITLDAPLLEDSEVEIFLEACVNGEKTTRPITLRGVVVWCGEDMDAGFIAGIRFDDVKEEHRRYLEGSLPSYDPV